MPHELSKGATALSAESIKKGPRVAEIQSAKSTTSKLLSLSLPPALLRLGISNDSYSMAFGDATVNDKQQ
jgi:hypothetical protein